jgi:hypothetical protein
MPCSPNTAPRREEAEPFFYPTFRAREADIRENIEDAVSDALDRA